MPSGPLLVQRCLQCDQTHALDGGTRPGEPVANFGLRPAVSLYRGTSAAAMISPPAARRPPAAAGSRRAPCGPQVPPVPPLAAPGAGRYHDDVTSPWSGQRRCDIVVVPRGPGGWLAAGPRRRRAALTCLMIYGTHPNPPPSGQIIRNARGPPRAAPDRPQRRHQRRSSTCSSTSRPVPAPPEPWTAITPLPPLRDLTIAADT